MRVTIVNMRAQLCTFWNGARQFVVRRIVDRLLAAFEDYFEAVFKDDGGIDAFGRLSQLLLGQLGRG